MSIALRTPDRGLAATPATAQRTAQTAWLCLRFAYLPLNAVGVRYRDQSNTVLTEEHQVLQCNQTAEDLGVRVGYSIGHTLMLNPTAALIERQCEQEALKLTALCEWAYRFTSHVSIYDEHTLLLEVGRSLSLFRGLKHLHHLISTDLERLQIDVCSAVAATPKAAYVLSYGYQQEWQLEHSQALLKHVYLADLDLHAKTIKQLQHCGFVTVGDVLTIPTAELGERFGQDTLQYLDQLVGQTADPQICTTPPETFMASVDFAEPIRNRLWIEQQVSRLLQDLLSFVQTRQLLCRGFVWRFYHENNRLLKSIEIKLNSTKLDLAMVQELTDLKFASSAIEWEFSRIELGSDELFARSMWHDDLFDPRPDQVNFNRLIDRLNSRLGTGAVRQITAQAEHLPELASHWVAMATTSATKPAPQNVKNLAAENVSQQDLTEPLWLLEHPRRLVKLTDGRPSCDGPLVFIHGPNRVSSHWWSQLCSRDYYIARQVSGRLLWVYFERTQQQWFMHGAFA